MGDRRFIKVSQRRSRCRGFSMIEVAISTLVLGLVAASGLHVVGLNAQRSGYAAQSLRARELAASLMREVTAMPFDDPEDEGDAFGIDTGETSGKRDTFDDVNDYNFHIESPPTDRDGVALGVPGSWARAVAVVPLNQWTLSGRAAADAGLVRVDVIVYDSSREVLRLTAYRSRGADAFTTAGFAEFIDDDGTQTDDPVDRTRLLDAVHKATAGVVP